MNPTSHYREILTQVPTHMSTCYYIDTLFILQRFSCTWVRFSIQGLVHVRYVFIVDIYGHSSLLRDAAGRGVTRWLVILI